MCTLIVYSVIILIFSRSVNLVLLVIGLEVLSWVLLVIIRLTIIFKYLLIQTIFILVSLLSIVLWTNGVLGALILKIRVPPMHLWFISILTNIRRHVFMFMITFHKVLPIFLLSKLVRNFLLIIGGLIILTNYLRLSQVRFYYIIRFSSFIHTTSTIMISLINSWLACLYWLFYSCIFWLIFWQFSYRLIDFNFSVMTGLCILVLSGMPPFLIFWFKINIFYWVLRFSWLLRYLVRIRFVLVFTAYLRVYYSSTQILEIYTVKWTWLLWLIPLSLRGFLLSY